MEVSNQSSLSSNPGASLVSTADNTQSAKSSDFQSFLQLLTAQLRNQDPLSPLDSTQFVEQLASFSAVEQQIETNDKLDALSDSLSGNALDDAAKWVGKHVEIEGGTARFEGEPLSFYIPSADDAGVTDEVIVRNSSGAIVYSEVGNGNAREFQWDGSRNDSEGTVYGDYTVSVNRYQDGDLVQTVQPRSIELVSQARFEDEGVTLVLANGTRVDPNAVLALRQPPETLTPQADDASESDLLSGDIEN